MQTQMPEFGKREVGGPAFWDFEAGTRRLNGILITFRFFAYSPPRRRAAKGKKDQIVVNSSCNVEECWKRCQAVEGERFPLSEGRINPGQCWRKGRVTASGKRWEVRGVASTHFSSSPGSEQGVFAKWLQQYQLSAAGCIFIGLALRRRIGVVKGPGRTGETLFDEALKMIKQTEGARKMAVGTPLNEGERGDFSVHTPSVILHFGRGHRQLRNGQGFVPRARWGALDPTPARRYSTSRTPAPRPRCPWHTVSVWDIRRHGGLVLRVSRAAPELVIALSGDVGDAMRCDGGSSRQDRHCFLPSSGRHIPAARMGMFFFHVISGRASASRLSSLAHWLRILVLCAAGGRFVSYRVVSCRAQWAAGGRDA
ncbi:hypothetical protein K438DRAFT_1783459 [Mycena galopus ATCC 62051]|nr:hypothetical protein K438DRAFT_1783459 [Mycena galopus ATCC 62051]